MEWITFIAAYPAWIKILLSVGAICIFVAVVGMIFSARQKEAEAPNPSVTVTSNSQQGGITANKVNIGK